MANSFLYAKGANIGKSLCEKDLKDLALSIIDNAKKNNCEIILPIDVVTTKELKNNAICQIVNSENVQNDDIIADMGPMTIDLVNKKIKDHQILVWNGPVGAFELKPFNIGTENIARIASLLTKNKQLISVSGGGDSVSALNQAGLAQEFSYISTAGGAFLEWLEGKVLPGVKILEK